MITESLEVLILDPFGFFGEFDGEIEHGAVGIVGTGEYEHSPIVTADNTLTLVKMETGIR